VNVCTYFSLTKHLNLLEVTPLCSRRIAVEVAVQGFESLLGGGEEGGGGLDATRIGFRERGA
jgi:hypothetical protein